MLTASLVHTHRARGAQVRSANSIAGTVNTIRAISSRSRECTRARGIVACVGARVTPFPDRPVSLCLSFSRENKTRIQ